MDVELVVDAHAEVGEGLVWDAVSSRVVWVDITRAHVRRFDPATGRDAVVDIGKHVGTAVVRRSGGLVLALSDGFAALDDDGTVTPIASVEAADPRTRFNDGKCDRRGRLWAGTMGYAETGPAGTLYRLDPDHSVHSMVAGVTVSNGIAWSLDDRLMYYIDSPTGRMDVFDFDLDAGAIANRRKLVDIAAEAGVPDGLTVDAAGYLWVAIWGGSCVRRYAPDGSFDREIRLLVTRVSSCAFGGPDLGDLYITSAARGLSVAELAAQPQAGGLFRVRPGVTGRPGNAFAG